MYKRPKKFPVAFHNDYNYEYLFIMERLSEEFKGQFDFSAKKHGEIHKLLGTNVRAK